MSKRGEIREQRPGEIGILEVLWYRENNHEDTLGNLGQRAHWSLERPILISALAFQAAEVILDGAPVSKRVSSASYAGSP
jgi:hypothetical protein